MPNKRSNRKNIKHFFCPFCDTRLWRLGSQKYHLFYKNKTEMRENLRISAKNAAFLAAQQSTCVDQNVWLEEFFCGEHGTMWLKISRQESGELASQLAQREDWQKTHKTFNPDCIHFSVSEYSYRMSRHAYYSKNAYQ